MSVVDLSSLASKSTVVPTEPIWRLTVPQYHEMIRTGILTDDDPVELLEGWLVTKMPKNRSHSLSTRLAREALEKIVPEGWYVDSQEPITTEDSEPEPDVTVVRGEPRDYADRHPDPEAVSLLVEVSDTSLARDRGPKKRLYAAARIPIYWIIHLAERQIEVYAEPSGPGEEPDYRSSHVYQASEEVPVVIDGRQIARIAAREMLP